MFSKIVSQVEPTVKKKESLIINRVWNVYALLNADIDAKVTFSFVAKFKNYAPVGTSSNL